MRANVNNGRLVFGLVVLVAGVLFTLDNLGMLDAWEYLRWWPVLLIVSGGWRIVQTRNAAGVIGGLIVAFIGVLMLDNFVHVLPGRVWNYWPVLLVLFGASMVVRAWQGPGGVSKTEDPAARFNAFALMSGVERKYNSPAFRGGDATAIMGGCEIDLRQAQIVDGPAVVDVFAFWGGVDLLVPSDWVVRNEAMVIMGGIADTRKSVGAVLAGVSLGSVKTGGSDVAGTDPNRVLVLRGGALMGGIEIKN